jgi:hypothetical protein
MSILSITRDLIRYSESNRIEAIRALNGSERLLIEKIFQGYQGLESQISQKDLSQISKKISLGHKSKDQGFLTRIAKIFKRITILLSGAKSAKELASLISEDWEMPVERINTKDAEKNDVKALNGVTHKLEGGQNNPKQIDRKLEEKEDNKEKAVYNTKKRSNKFTRPIFGPTPTYKEVLKKMIEESSRKLDQSRLYEIWKDLHDPFSLVD